MTAGLVVVPIAPASAALASCAIAVPTDSTPTNSTLTGRVKLEAPNAAGAGGTQFYVDGKSVGFGYDLSTSGRWQFAQPGTATNGFDMTAYANESHRFSCRYFGPGVAPGPVGPEVHRDSANTIRSTLSGLADNYTVDATLGSPSITLKMTNVVSGGTTQPTSATFYVDGVAVGSGACSAGVCSYSWAPSSPPPLDDGNPDSLDSGLRVLNARAVAPNGIVTWAAPIRVYVNHSDVTVGSRPGARHLMSSFEYVGRGRVVRDGGWSEVIPGTSEVLFAFGDGGLQFGTGSSRGLHHPVFHSSLATTPKVGGLPGLLTERPNPEGWPLPAPYQSQIVQTVGLTDPNGGTCQYHSTWPTGMVKNPANNNLLVPYISRCLENASGGNGGEAWSKHQISGVADYNPSTGVTGLHNVFVAPPGGVLNQRQVLSTPVVDGTNMYFYNAYSTGTYALKVSTASWRDKTAYRWSRNGVFDQSDPNLATSIGAGSSQQISVDRYPTLTGSPYLKITQPGDWKKVTIQKSATPYGPWTTVVSNHTVCWDCRQSNSQVDGGDVYTVYGHPEFTVGNKVVLTYTDYATGRPMSTTVTVP